MEPVTHVLTGACLARAGFNRRTAYATVGMAIAAELPDIDTLWSLRGPIAGFQHHRGITHTFVGIPFEAAILLSGIALVHHYRSRPGLGNTRGSKYETPAPPVRWGVLYALLLLALLSHLWLDYTNNYGLRPFFPFDQHWYAGSLVFIFDPLLFLFLVAGLTLPALFRLISGEVGARSSRFPSRLWAATALAAVALLWTVRWIEHGRAISLAQAQSLRAPAPSESTGTTPSESDESRPLLVAQRSLASPDPLSIFRWYTASDFGPTYRLGVADTRSESLTPGDVLAKPEVTSALRAAEESRLGKVYLDWSAMPLLSVTPVAGNTGAVAGDQVVTFEDLRFLGDLPILHHSESPPLSGTVYLDSADQVSGETINGKVDH